MTAEDYMRAIGLLLLVGLLSACTATSVTAPREYLDERTAATITVVKDPWIFTREQDAAVNTQHRDFLHLYAIDVNRMGDHRQYFAVLQAVPPENVAGVRPTLELTSGEHATVLEATQADPRELGIAHPIAESYTLAATWWYFPVDKQTLATIANTRELHAAMIANDQRIPYVLWRDGREELSELTAVLP
jgi:hypothetical protein